MEDDTKTLAGSDGISVHAGFPNPAADAARGQGAPLALDLNQLLVRRPHSTYLFRVSGHAWADQGVYDGDVAIVDRAPAPNQGDLVISWQASGFTLCRYRELGAGEEALGVVTAIVHRFGGA